MNSLHPIAMPKPIRVMAPPKIASVHIAKVGGGFKAQHMMTSGPHRNFVFNDPRKLMTHLNRIQANEWREPDRNEGSAVTHTLNLNA